MSKRRHNFGTKRFKEKSLFIFNARIVLKSLILLFVRLIARGARIGKTDTQTHRHTDRHTDRTSTVTLAHARRGLITYCSNYTYPLYLKVTIICRYIHFCCFGILCILLVLNFYTGQLMIFMMACLQYLIFTSITFCAFVQIRRNIKH